MRRLGPERLVAMTIGGAVLMASTWFLVFVPIPRVPMHGCGFWDYVWSNRLRFAAYFLPFFSGLALTIGVGKRFRRGFLDDRWTEAELARVREVLSSRLWRWGSLVVVVGAVCSLLFRRYPYGGSLVYILLLPFQRAQELRRMVTPRVERGSGLADWRNFGPLRSEHWGERSA